MGKVLAKDTIESTLEETQYGFRKELHCCFIDLEKAFDRIKRKDVWQGLRTK